MIEKMSVFSKGGEHYLFEGEKIIGEIDDEEKAAYIVRACNSFPALVEALKAFVSAADHAAAGQPLALYRAKELAFLADALTKAGE
jgi:hypothetical protein